MVADTGFYSTVFSMQAAMQFVDSTICHCVDQAVCDSLTGIAANGIPPKGIALYPNPNTGSFTLAYDLPDGRGGTLTVYDMQMRKVLERPLPNAHTQQRIELPGIAEGLYQVVLTRGTWQVTERMMVSRGN
jgi:hypothetical protein